MIAADIVQLAGLGTRNPSAQSNKWKKQGLIFTISHSELVMFLTSSVTVLGGTANAASGKAARRAISSSSNVLLLRV